MSTFTLSDGNVCRRPGETTGDDNEAKFAGLMGNDSEWYFTGAKLFPNVKGCGYPPMLNCSIFYRQYANIGQNFSCYYSKVDPGIVISDLDMWQVSLRFSIFPSPTCVRLYLPLFPVLMDRAPSWTCFSLCVFLCLSFSSLYFASDRSSECIPEVPIVSLCVPSTF